jgi:hypothetical protein
MCKHKRPNQIDDRQLKQMLMTRASGTECVCLEASLRGEAVAVATLNKHSPERQ